MSLNPFSSKSGPLQTWQVILFIAIIGIAGVLSFVQRSNAPQDVQEDLSLNEFICTASGGTWNACGSACRGDDQGACIQVCVEQCECRSDAQCPFGYACLEYVNDIGICIKE